MSMLAFGLAAALAAGERVRAPPEGGVILEGGDAAALQPWIGLILLSDALFLVAGLWLFESLTSE